jgi:hypothetical protein
MAMRISRSSAALLAVVVLLGCGGGDRFEAVGIAFDLPPGWTSLEPAELEARGAAVDTMIGSADRSAIAFAQELRGVPPAAIDSNPYGGGTSLRLARIAAAVEAALPNRYQDYRFGRHGATTLGREPAVEIDFVGREPGEDLRWRRLVLASPDPDRVLMFGFGCPVDERDDHADALASIQASWELAGR